MDEHTVSNHQFTAFHSSLEMLLKRSKFDFPTHEPAIAKMTPGFSFAFIFLCLIWHAGTPLHSMTVGSIALYCISDSVALPGD